MFFLFFRPFLTGKTDNKWIKQHSTKKLLKVFYPSSDSDIKIRQVGERQVINYLNPTDDHGKDANIF
jgi:hypothetical protein